MNKVILAIALASASLPGQWIHNPTSGIPRTAGGKPDLSAPAPKTPDGKPDLSGIWGMNPGAYIGNIATDLKPGEVQPWADALYKQRMENLSKDDPAQYQCVPQGPRINLIPFLMQKILQTPTVIATLSEDLTYRQIFLDGRTLPKDPNPSFMGYSVGHWDGDTLVVKSTGYNDRTWLDFGGHPHTEALRITERYHRRDFGHLEIGMTIDDPAIYSKPIMFTIQANLVPDTELIEYLCAENEQDRQHLVGKASDDLKYAVKVAAEVLAHYVGAYEFRFPENPSTAIVSNVTLSNGDLYLDTEGKDKVKLIPLSETRFSILGDKLEFVKDDHGAVTHFISIAAEGDLKSLRVAK